MKVDIGGYTIILHSEALSVMEFFTQKNDTQPESGGIILGKLIGNEVHILRLSPPTELDRSSRMNFERHRLSAQIIIDYEFHNSNRQVTYLGEWHTHPEKLPTPSPTDRNMIKTQFSKNHIHTDFLLLIIKGVLGFYIGIIDKNDTFSKQVLLH